MAEDLSFEHALEIITKTDIQTYEFLRQSGMVNMFDYFQVVDLAARFEPFLEDRFGYAGLVDLSYEDYGVLIMNFGRLMEHFGITQDKMGDDV